MGDLLRIILVIVAPPAAGAVAIRALRARARRRGPAVSRHATWGLAMSGTQCVVQLLLLIPVILWYSQAGPPERILAVSQPPLGLPLFLVSALSLVLALRLAAQGTTRWAIHRMKRARHIRAGALPGVQMRRMFGHIAERRFFAIAIITGIVGGVYEELAYRGLLQSVASLRLGLLGGLLLASAIFALSHAFYGPTGVLFALVSGLILGASVALLGSVAPAVAAHAAYNCLTLVSAYRKPQPSGRIAEMMAT